MNRTMKGRVACVTCLVLALVLLVLPIPAGALTGGEADVPRNAGSGYYGRGALEALPNSTALVYAYDSIVAGVEAANESIPVYNGADPLTENELATVMDAYVRDYAHHFWLAPRYSYSYNETTVLSLSPEYLMTGEELSTAKVEFESRVSSILSGISSSMSDFDKELYLHDVLASRITYVEGSNAHNAYGALVLGKAVCEGYAEAFQYLLQRVGICSFLALGASADPSTGASVNHEWNYVKLGGSFYHVDLTWDDQSSHTYHAYFNVSDAMITEDHQVFSAGYALPTCSSDSSSYFAVRGGKLSGTTYSTESVGTALRNGNLEASFYVTGNVQGFLDWFSANIREIASAAGVTGGFSYGWSVLGHEVDLMLVLPVCTHGTLTFHPENSASCETAGNDAYYVCTCGKWFSDASATDEIVDHDSVIRAAKNHDYDLTAYGYIGTDGHAHVCKAVGCSVHDAVAPHIPGAAATETTPQTCTACGFVINAALGHTTHTPTDEWSTDGTWHWHRCTGCEGEILDKGKHVYDNACDVDCNVCLAVRVTEHAYDNVCDPECNVCKATRVTEHVYGSALASDRDGHYYECAGCHHRKDEAAHVPGAEPTESTPQTCTVCSYVIKAALGHQHGYGTEWTTDAKGHWYACGGCNEPKDYGDHTDATADGVCDTCGYVMFVIPETTVPEETTGVETDPTDSDPPVTGETEADGTEVTGTEVTGTEPGVTDPETAPSDGTTEPSDDSGKDDAPQSEGTGCAGALGWSFTVLLAVAAAPAATVLRKKRD